MAKNISLYWNASSIFPPVIGPSTIGVSPNDSYAVSQSYAAYGCLVGVLVLVFIALTIKISLNRKRFQARNAALRQTIARQNQLSTVSHSIDEGGNNSRESDATLKIDLPPTYEEVMSNFVDARERIATTSTYTGGDGAVETRNTRRNFGDEIVTIPEERS